MRIRTPHREPATRPAQILSSVPDLWGGVECTVNRVGHRYLDQLALSGHDARVEDLERFAELGLKTLRYPFLWERAQKRLGDEPDWSWANERLTRLKQLGIRPIAGLVHHGSGPLGTSLLEGSFAAGLARYAGHFAERFPWVSDYTPVNETLTTARFSGLYGHWYPHDRSPMSFVTALLVQCKATALSMAAIRRVNPRARLCQTDDLGTVYSSPAMAYQADFENERRWLSWDLLAGKVDRDHPLADFLKWVGVSWDELAWFLDHPCPADVIGVNHYVTSDRYLDEQVEHYPCHSIGTNGRDTYADVEAVRAHDELPLGVGPLLMAAAERYGRPVAITEAHLGCTREQQLRWLYAVWGAAVQARQAGVPVEAVTVWSLLGAYDWNSLLTREARYYEPGVFDLRGPAPRETALGQAIRTLSCGKDERHPTALSAGWWQTPARRLFQRPCANNGKARTMEAPVIQESGPPLLIAGGGTLGRAFARTCEARGLNYRLLRRREMDITDPVQIEAAVVRCNPWAVINAAGFVCVDRAEEERERCHRENTIGPRLLAEACRERSLPLLTFSTDLVFDGSASRPYQERDDVRPLNVYGHSKVAAERDVLATSAQVLVVRTSAFFGPWDEANFVWNIVQALKKQGSCAAANDQVVSPTYVPDLVDACLDLLIDGETGVWHIATQGGVTWCELAQAAAERAGFPTSLVQPRPTLALGLRAPRPPYSVLGSSRGMLLGPLDDALDRMFLERRELVS